MITLMSDVILVSRASAELATKFRESYPEG